MMNLIKAEGIAKEICSRLDAHSYICEIAGSIRRKKPIVKDIEIVCLPFKTIVKKQLGLFDNQYSFDVVIDKSFEDYVNSLGKIVRGNVYGRYMKIETKFDISLDLFLPSNTDFFRQFAIRTGSSKFSAARIAKSWRNLGWVGTSEGLRLEEQCNYRNGRWVCLSNNPKLPPVWQSEEEFFMWLGMEWIHPSKRI